MDKEPVYFEVGDTVYHWRWGKGIVEQPPPRKAIMYDLRVKFEDGVIRWFNTIGQSALDDNAMSTLSQTPYDFIKGGFTLKPKVIVPKIEKGTLVYIKFHSYNLWDMRYFSHFDKDGNMYVFNNQLKEAEIKNTSKVTVYSLTNPLEEK